MVTEEIIDSASKTAKVIATATICASIKEATVEIALLGLRLVIGLGFAAHGAQKLFGILGGHGIEGTAGFFEQIGLRPGRLHAWAAGSSEFFGGLLIAVGLVTPFAAAV